MRNKIAATWLKFKNLVKRTRRRGNLLVVIKVLIALFVWLETTTDEDDNHSLSMKFDTHACHKYETFKYGVWDAVIALLNRQV